jgi:TadE-like protein
MFRRDTTRGQSMVEFALILPILMFLLMGFFDLGRVVLAHDALGHAAREAARYAIVHGATATVHGGSLTGTCPSGPLPNPLPPGVTAPTASSSCPYPSPSTQAIKDEAIEQARAAGSAVTVEVCYGLNCTGDTNVVGASNVRGTPVTVTVRSTVDMTAGALIGFGSFSVISSSTMLVNH